MQARSDLFKDSANWAYIAIVLAVIWYGFQILFLMGVYLWAQLPYVSGNPQLIDDFYDGATPSAVRWTLATFAIYTALLALMLRTLHQRGLRHLIGQTARTWQEFSRVSIYLLPLYAFLVLPSILAPDVTQNMGFARWLGLLPTLLPLLFIQISSEELVFRGYLQSHLSALSKHPLVWMGVPSVLFGLVHYDPLGPSYSAWAYVAWAACLGLVCSDLTARSQTLGPAFAVHFINNAGALLILAADDWLFGAALYIWPTNGAAWEPWIPYEALVLLCVWLSARLALRR